MKYISMDAFHTTNEHPHSFVIIFPCQRTPIVEGSSRLKDWTVAARVRNWENLRSHCANKGCMLL